MTFKAVLAVSMISVSIGRAKSQTNSAAGFLKGEKSNYAGAARPWLPTLAILRLVRS